MSEKWKEVKSTDEIVKMLKVSALIVSTHSSSDPRIPRKVTWKVVSVDAFWAHAYAAIGAAIATHGRVYAYEIEVAKAA